TSDANVPPGAPLAVRSSVTVTVPVAPPSTTVVVPPTIDTVAVSLSVTSICSDPLAVAGPMVLSASPGNDSDPSINVSSTAVTVMSAVSLSAAVAATNVTVEAV